MSGDGAQVVLVCPTCGTQLTSGDGDPRRYVYTLCLTCTREQLRRAGWDRRSGRDRRVRQILGWWSIRRDRRRGRDRRRS